MMDSLDTDAIEARKQEIDDQIAELQKEAEELEIALRVLQRFAGTGQGTAQGGAKLGPPRPEGIPTLFQMAYQVIRDAEHQGKMGLQGKEVVEAIGKRYWPGVQGQQILPSLYAMAKKGRLKKSSNGLFQTVRTKEAPSAETEGASDSTGEVDASPNEARSNNDLLGRFR